MAEPLDVIGTEATSFGEFVARHRHRWYRWRLAIGCVVAVAVLALAVSLVSHGSREGLVHRMYPHAPQVRFLSCVQAATHEARTLCARYAGPAVAPIVARPPQAPGGPVLCRVRRPGC